MTRYRIADDVAWVSREELDAGDTPSAYVARLPDGRPMTLEGSACVVWLALSDGGTLEEIAAAAATMSDAEPEAIAGDVAHLVAELISVGLVAGG